MGVYTFVCLIFFSCVDTVNHLWCHKKNSEVNDCLQAKWKASAMLVLWSDGYLCDPDYEVTGICVSPIMKWRVSLWARLWSDGYLCEPNKKWAGICVSPIKNWAGIISDMAVCVCLMGLEKVNSNTLFSEEGSLDQVSRSCSHWVRRWGFLWTLEIGVRSQGVKISLARLIPCGEL